MATPNLSRKFASWKCEKNVGEALEQEDKVSIEMETA